jgi:hypothetical protein
MVFNNVLYMFFFHEGQWNRQYKDFVPIDPGATAWSGVTSIPTGFGLLRVFCPLAFAETDTRTTSVLVDEFDAGQLQDSPNGQIIGRRH